MRQSSKKLVWFTLTELLVSIVISIIILWGIFFFISETLLSLARSSAQSDFLKGFYSFTTILNSWEFEILSTSGYDIWLLVSPDTWNGVMVWVIDADTKKLIPVADFDSYLPWVMAYRQVQASDITLLRSNILNAYDFKFLGDTIFNEFYVKDFSLVSYSGWLVSASWAITELVLDIFPFYSESLKGTDWSLLPKDEVFRYSLVF